MNKELKEEMLKNAAHGKLSCTDARKIAGQLGISLREVGAAANELGIRIRSCELGCF